MRKILERTLEALASRSLRLAAHGATGEGLERRKIFELIRKGDSLQIDLGGTIYDLVSQAGGGAH